MEAAIEVASGGMACEEGAVRAARIVLAHAEVAMSGGVTSVSRQWDSTSVLSCLY